MRKSFPLSQIMSQLLKGREDIYRGITILSENNRITPEEAPEVLRHSLKEWKEKNVHGIWFKVLSSVRNLCDRSSSLFTIAG